MIRSFDKRRRAVVFSIAALAGSLASAGLYSATASASSTVTKTSHYTLTCNLGILGNATFPGSHVTASWPASVKHGAKFSTSFAALTIIPVSYSAKAYALGGRAYSAAISTYNITSTDASPSSYNAAPFTIPKTPLYKNKPIILPTPLKGTLPVHLRAGNPGTATVTLGNSITKATLYNSSGFAFLTLTATCQPPQPPSNLGSVKVT